MHWGHFADGGYWQIRGTGLLWETSLLEATRKLKLGTPAQLSHGSSVPTLAIIGTCLCIHHNYSHQLGLAFSAVHLSSSLFLWSQLWHSHTLCLIVLLHDVCSLYTFFQFLFPLTAQGPYSLYFPFNFQKQKGREGEKGGRELGAGEREREKRLLGLVT